VRKAATIRGMAHITGGGLTDNVPRILPDGLSAEIDCTSWRIPPVFQFLHAAGKVDTEEMYRVFNMGIGFMLMVRRKDEEAALKALKTARAGARVIGRIAEGDRRVELNGLR
jgi:phosphoribosylformylglycinamidine cyclo-ligase